MLTSLERIKQYIDCLGVSTAQFEKAVGFSNGAFASQLKNKKSIGIDKLENILRKYPELNAEWVLNGEGEMLKQKKKEQNYIEDPYDTKQLLPLLPFDAFAGKGLAAFQDLKVERKYDIHEFRTADFLIRIKGNSMYPKYSSGDIIACKLIKENLFFQWHKPHVLYTESQGVMVKRLCKSTLNDHVLCVSDNEKYEPFNVPLSDILGIAIIIGAVRLE